jgi:multidrug efflux pump subunit AcrA (membrane-fusion protein)
MEKKKKGKRFILLIIIGVLVLVVVLLIGRMVVKMMDPEGAFAQMQKQQMELKEIMDGSSDGEDNADSGKMTAKKDDETEETVFAVNTFRASTGQLIDYIDINGDIIASGSVDVYPDTMGKIVRIRSGLGSYVRKGDIIAEIDPSRPGMDYALSPVKAPVAGTITYVNDNIGTMITQQMPVATVGILSKLQIRTYIPERFISKVDKGMNAQFTLEAYPGVGFDAVVSEVSPVVDPVSRTLEIKLDMVNQDPRVKAGMFAKIRLTTDIKKGIIKIPADCVIDRFGEKFVFIVNEDSTVVKRTITIGLQVGDVVEILDGIESGEVIVYQGQTLLDNGSKVNVKRELSPFATEE